MTFYLVAVPVLMSLAIGALLYSDFQVRPEGSKNE